MSDDSPRIGPLTPSGRMLPPKLGRYPVTGRLGKGGIGEVLHVRDEVLGRSIAAKILHDPSDSVVREAFLFEARVLAHLQHPSIVPVHELGTDADGCPYFTMRVVQGESLHDRLARLARTPSTDGLPALIDAFLGVCGAMSYAHSRGVLHLDLKPANVMLGAELQDRGRIQIVDWGLARLHGARAEDLEDLAGLPALAPLSDGDSCGLSDGTLRVMGTPAYMPPEQATGSRADLDRRADIYSLGAILYHMLCRVPPYVGETSEEMLAKLAEGPPLSPSERNPQASVPWELEAIALRAMSPKRARRYRNVDELARDIERWRDDRPVNAATYGPVGRLRKLLRGRRLAWSGVALMAAMTIVMLMVALDHAKRSSRDAERELADARGELAVIARREAAAAAQLEATRRRLAVNLRRRAEAARADRLLLEAAIYSSVSGRSGREISAPVPPLVLDRTTRDHQQTPTALALTPDGRQLASAAGPVILLQDVDSKKLRRLAHPKTAAGPIRQLVFGPRGEQLAALDDARLVLWSVATGTPIAELPLPAPARRVAFAPEGKLLALAGGDAVIQLLDTRLRRTGAPLVHHQQVLDLVFLPGGQRLASACGDGVIRLWDPLTAQLVAELSGPAGAARSVTPSPDGRWLAAGADDRTIHVWDLRTFHRVRTLTGHKRPVTALAFAADGRRLLSIAEGGQLRLWGVNAGTLIQAVRGHGAALVTLAAATRSTPSGGRLTDLATASADGGTQRWELLSDLPRAPRTYSVAQAERISGLRMQDGALTPIAPDDFAELRQHVQLVTDE